VKNHQATRPDFQQLPETSPRNSTNLKLYVTPCPRSIANLKKHGQPQTDSLKLNGVTSNMECPVPIVKHLYI